MHLAGHVRDAEKPEAALASRRETMNWLLIVCIVIVLGCVAIGWKQGFVKMIFHLISFILALALSAMFYKPVVKKVVEQERLMTEAEQKVNDFLKLDALEEKATITNEDIDKLNLPEALKEKLKDCNTEENFNILKATNAKEYVCRMLSNLVIRAAVFVVMFIVILAVIYLVGGALNILSKLPLLNALNRLSGAAIGLIFGVALVCLFFASITALANTGFGQTCMTTIMDNEYLKFVYDKNPLNNIIISMASKF